MCGRYRLSRRKHLIEEYFARVSGEDDWTPRCNIAPTQPVPVIRQNPKEPRRELSLLRWGLIPSWAKDPVNFRSNDQGKIGNSGDEARFPKPRRQHAVPLQAKSIHRTLGIPHQGTPGPSVRSERLSGLKGSDPPFLLPPVLRIYTLRLALICFT
jgi:hypothetical protein